MAEHFKKISEIRNPDMDLIKQQEIIKPIKAAKLMRVVFKQFLSTLFINTKNSTFDPNNQFGKMLELAKEGENVAIVSNHKCRAATVGFGLMLEHFQKEHFDKFAIAARIGLFEKELFAPALMTMNTIIPVASPYHEMPQGIKTTGSFDQAFAEKLIPIIFAEASDPRIFTDKGEPHFLPFYPGVIESSIPKDGTIIPTYIDTQNIWPTTKTMPDITPFNKTPLSLEFGKPIKKSELRQEEHDSSFEHYIQSAGYYILKQACTLLEHESKEYIHEPEVQAFLSEIKAELEVRKTTIDTLSFIKSKIEDIITKQSDSDFFKKALLYLEYHYKHINNSTSTLKRAERMARISFEIWLKIAKMMPSDKRGTLGSECVAKIPGHAVLESFYHAAKHNAEGNYPKQDSNNEVVWNFIKTIGTDLETIKSDQDANKLLKSYVRFANMHQEESLFFKSFLINTNICKY